MPSTNWFRSKLFRINSGPTLFRALIGWPLISLGLYFAAGLIGSMIPVNADWQQATKGHPIYLHNNGVHTSIILPNDPQLAQMFPASHLPGNPPDARYLAFGWGDREFYLNTPYWRDVRPRVVLNAIVGSGATLLHVDHLPDILPGSKRLIIDAQSYRTIVATIINTRKDAASPPIRGYGDADIFYLAKGRSYSALYTCNNWTASVLREAGIRTGLWTPLPGGVMWWYD